MSTGLGTGRLSLAPLRNLGETDQALSRVFERLSSGQRINRASDDAAGLAIAESLNTDQRVFTQAVRNLNDGVSLLSIADSALDELSGITTRLVELAQQSANGAYSDQQREALNIEAQALSEEFTRIMQSTEFNGLGILNGGLEQGIALQGGYGVEGAIVSTVGDYLGSGEFSTTGLSYGNDYGVNGVQTGDINGDGILDLVTAGAGGLDVLLGLGNGEFTEGTDITSAGTSTTSNDLALQDLNNDGILDIVAAGQSGRGAGDFTQVFLGNGDGTFNDAGSYSEGSDPINAVELADINGDGILDMVVGADAFLGNISGVDLRLGNGDGTFGTAMQLGSSISGLDVDALAVADFDNDGDLDILAAGTTNGGAGVGGGNIFYNNGDASSFEVSTNAITAAEGFTALDVGDLDGDGLIDIAAVNNGILNSELEALINKGDGGFGQASAISLGASSPIAVDIADLNGDGNLDVVTQSANSQSMLNDGEGRLTNTNSTGIFGYRAIADLNEDGILDIITDTGVRIGEARGGLNPILEFSLDTLSDARQALPQLQRKLELVSEQRGIIGALQSRLPTAINVLQANTENYAAARSRIVDADIAEETSKLVSNQIKRQAIASVLAQSNQSASLTLSLLQSSAEQSSRGNS